MENVKRTIRTICDVTGRVWLGGRYASRMVEVEHVSDTKIIIRTVKAETAHCEPAEDSSRGDT